MKYLLTILSYAISSVWLYLCYTNMIPKMVWLVVILLIVLLIVQSNILGKVATSIGRVHRFYRLLRIVLVLPLIMLVIGGMLFLINNYSPSGGGAGWIYY